MAKLHDLKSQHTEALDKAEAVLTRAEAAGRKELLAPETSLMESHLAEAKKLETQIPEPHTHSAVHLRTV
jgi:hypothetical protein